MLITQGLGIGVYATLNFLRYSLLVSTLIDNYSATHLVNNKDLFKPGSFIKVITNKSVKVRLFMLLILGHGTRIIKRTLNSALGPIITDLILKNITIIKGFYVNIISEAHL
jgi:hypothetical protein